MTSTVCAMENTLDETDSRLDVTEENISELGAITVETIQNKTQRGKKNENTSLLYIWKLPRVDLKSLHHKKRKFCNYVRWRMLSRLTMMIIKKKSFRELKDTVRQPNICVINCILWSKDRWRQKEYLKKQWPIVSPCPTFNENYTSIDARNSASPLHKRHERK